jgi:hypothetical protein
MEVQDSVVVKFVSAGPYGAGLYTAVFTDPISCSFPPILTLTQIHGGRPARPARRRPPPPPPPATSGHQRGWD